MLIYGISNRLDNNHSLFFYEFDNENFKLVHEEARMLVRMFGVDIAILESSKNNYHLVSFDVMTTSEVRRMCNYVTIPSDFVHIGEQKLLGNPYNDNCLRLGKKFNKGNPKFVMWIIHKENDRYKAINHLLVYHSFCGVPLIKVPEFLKVPYKVFFVIYNTGVKRKRWFGGCRKKQYTKL